MRGRLKHIVINYLIRHLLKTINVDDLFRKVGNSWYIGRRRVTAQELQDLRDEADNLKNSEIWRLMTREMLWHSNLNMFEKATVSDDMLFGKAMLYLIEQQNRFLDNLEKNIGSG